MILYKITCLNTGKIYIGITRFRSTHRRWNQHWANARRVTHTPTALYIEMRAIPRDRWIIEDISLHQTYDDLLKAEREAIATHRTMNPEVGYNRTSGGQGTLGVRFKKTAEQIEKSARFHRGRPRTPSHIAALHAGLARADRRQWKTKSRPDRDVAIMAHYFSSPSLASTGAAFGIKAAAVSMALKRTRSKMEDELAAMSPIYEGIVLPPRIHPDHLGIPL